MVGNIRAVPAEDIAATGDAGSSRPGRSLGAYAVR